MTTNVEQLAVNTIKALSIDAIQKANSGHPGMPMGMADLAVVVWSQFLTEDPDDPTWPDRDRFCSVQRPRLDAAVFAAPPRRLPDVD